MLHAIGSLNIGGSQAFVMNLYRNIDRSKVQFDFVIEHPGELHYKDEIESLGGRVFEIQPFRGANIFSYRRQWEELIDAHPEWHVLHSHVRSTASLYFPITHKHGIINVIHSHSSAELKGFSGSVKRIMELPLRHQADYYFACSRSAAVFLYGNRIADANRWVLIPNAFDVENFRFNSEIRKEVRLELGIDQNTFVVGHVGRFVEAKNHTFVINAFRSVYERNPSSVLVLVGDGQLMEPIQELVESYGLSSSVLFLGARNDVGRLYQAMDVFLFPSQNEGLGIALVEAQSSGLSCVFSECIPQEARVIAELCHPLSLSQDTSVWADSCLTSRCENRDRMADTVASAGYDVRYTANMLQSFYLGL